MLRSIRLGHATNSSSAHSIIFHRGADTRVEKHLPDTHLADIDEYSRDKYSFTDPYKKAVLLLRDRASFNLSNHNLLEVRNVLDRYDISRVLDEDHSNLPLEQVFHADFTGAKNAGIGFADWLDFLLSPEITLYGYDDNYGNPGRDLVSDGIAIDITRDLSWKKDGDAIIAYAPSRGTKLRWSRTPYEKASTPELVDVKITDYCGYGCSFCYQGSTKAGQHAPLERIEGIFDQLADMRVFEVAIGGGEPAHHPQFAEIIEAATARCLTFNFTAFGLDWAANDRVMAAMKQNHGNGIGLSVHSRRDIVKVVRAEERLREKGIYGTQVMGQTVIGATPMTTIEATLDACVGAGVPLLLLGFKETGRGVGYSKARASDTAVRRLLQKARSATQDSKKRGTPFTLSVDTAFLDAYGHILDEMDVPHDLRTSPEGKFSMYVDAVNNTCGPSSYCKPSLMEPVGDIRQQFSGY